jgi:hypothetical protein
MNRHERRRQEALNRREKVKAGHNRFHNDYVRHLPSVPLDAPLEPGRVYHEVHAHDDDCRIYSGKACSCNPVITRHVEPKRT